MGEDNASSSGSGRSAPEMRREQILEAARLVLAEVGFERITTRRIAEAAGVNIATLHYYFGAKETLLTEAVRYALRRTERRLRAAMEQSPDAAAALENAFHALWELVQERPGALRYDLVVRGLRDQTAREEARAIYAAYRRLIEEILEQHRLAGGTLAGGVTTQTFATYVVAAVDGVILQHLITGDDDATRESLALIRRHALSLMRGRETTDEAKSDD